MLSAFLACYPTDSSGLCYSCKLCPIVALEVGVIQIQLNK